MSVKLELYKVFKEVAEAGNITAAAQALFISQSAHKDLPTRQNFVMNAVLAWLQF